MKAPDHLMCEPNSVAAAQDGVLSYVTFTSPNEAELEAMAVAVLQRSGRDTVNAGDTESVNAGDTESKSKSSCDSDVSQKEVSLSAE